MQKNAPYADTPIPIHLQAVSGMKYRLLNCVECSREFLERQGDAYYRIGNKELPEEAHADDSGGIPTRCGNCQQSYTVFFATSIAVYRSDQLLYQKPQTIFLAPAVTKAPRNAYCLECHHAYLSVCDRVSMISDDTVPLEHISAMGPVEVRCKSNKCKQRWQIRM